MARNRRVVKCSGTAYYHVISRTNGRRYILNHKVKDEMSRILKKVAAFSGITINGFCFMDDHFHIVCKVVKSDELIPENEVIKRIAILKGDRFATNLSEHWTELRKLGLSEMVETALNHWRSRMDNLSEFVKSFKELVNVMYKTEYEHCGGLWSGRFKSTLIEDGQYLATCIRYVEFNPVRAGMVSRAAEYKWSSAKEQKTMFFLGKMGSVPEKTRIGKRIIQISNGVIFGSREFVTAAIFGHGHCFIATHITARPVEDWAFSSHGHSKTRQKPANPT